MSALAGKHNQEMESPLKQLEKEDPEKLQKKLESLNNQPVTAASGQESQPQTANQVDFRIN